MFSILKKTNITKLRNERIFVNGLYLNIHCSENIIFD